MKSLTTRNIQIEKQVRRILSKTADVRVQRRSGAKPLLAKKARKSVKKGRSK
jgi:hypothetical protein